jgi:DNA-binding transcriptional LysR family regulator
MGALIGGLATAAPDATAVNGWLGVELRYLVTLRAVADEHSFRGAAERLGYTQSAISQQIIRLERSVGARLVRRSRGQPHVTLTEAGAVLVEHTDRILAELAAARASVLALAEPRS